MRSFQEISARITQAEMAAFTRAATGGHFIPLKFGPGWVEIDTDSRDAEWALAELRRIRNEVQS